MCLYKVSEEFSSEKLGTAVWGHTLGHPLTCHGDKGESEFFKFIWSRCYKNYFYNNFSWFIHISTGSQKYHFLQYVMILNTPGGRHRSVNSEGNWEIRICLHREIFIWPSIFYMFSSFKKTISHWFLAIFIWISMAMILWCKIWLINSILHNYF